MMKLEWYEWCSLMMKYLTLFGTEVIGAERHDPGVGETVSFETRFDQRVKLHRTSEVIPDENGVSNAYSTLIYQTLPLR